jgi:hypothetical protein
MYDDEHEVAGYEFEPEEAMFDEQDHARRGVEPALRAGDELASDSHVLTARQIVVRAERDGEMPGEWTMIELQGAIETGSTAMPGLELGELTILPGVRARAKALLRSRAPWACSLRRNARAHVRSSCRIRRSYALADNFSTGA